MPTASNIKEPAWRVGCGRYLQEAGAISLVGEEVRRLGAKRPFVLTTKTPMAVAGADLRRSFSEAGCTGVFHLYTGFCCRTVLDAIGASEEFAGCDAVVGLGGGNMMDAAKYLAVQKGLPVINVPTSSATCAAPTPLSVCYTEEGRTVGSVHHKTEVNCVVADLGILCRQPVRLFLAGVYDALAKAIEIEQRLLPLSPAELDIGLAAAYRNSLFIRDFFDRNLEACVADLRAGKPTKLLGDAIWITVLLTGVVSGLSRGSNQTAVGHKLYEAARTVFPREVYSFLHGELVAVGLIVQTAYNGKDDPAAFAARMKALGLPTTVRDLGLPGTDATLDRLWENVVASTAMKGTTDEEKRRLRRCLETIR